MKKLLIVSIVLFFISCNSAGTFKKAEDAQDAGREFIRASLDGDQEKAEFYLWQDSTNRVLMSKWEQDYHRLDEQTKKQYKDADILVINFKNLNDSTATYTFSNSYKKDTTTIRIVRLSGEWLVDLKEILKSKDNVGLDEILNPTDSVKQTQNPKPDK
ncbi:MAG: hypothetical protein JST75_05440 [Bacteroidetes bacterium]|nr:hypothetical protein [Bacteroidota bacterium]